MPDVAIIGHRGAMAHELENSMASFERALELGAGMIELDVHLLSDGQVIVMHDDTLSRTTTGKGSLLRSTMRDLEKIRLRNGEAVPTLDNVLERFKGQCQLNIEIKGIAADIPSLNMVKKFGMLEEVLFSAFNGPWLLNVKSMDRKARIAFVSDDRKHDMVRIATSLRAEAIHPSYRLVTPNLVEEAHEKGLRVNVWTVNKPVQIQRMMDMGVDGIITDKPDVLSKMLG